MAQLRNDPEVAYAQIDHELNFRAAVEEAVESPELNTWGIDQLTEENLYTMRAKETWDNFGLDRNDEIVVMVIDGGFDLSHPDLVESIFVNKNEIPDNGIDDDNNGLIDDINGWNFKSNTPIVDVSAHGTHVVGIINSNRQTQLSAQGVNQNIKILPIQISMTGLHTSEVVSAYEYAIRMKQLWVETEGEMGANIVVTNSSFGLDGRDCNSDEFAVWNDVYDRLGDVGILSAVATTNLYRNVDNVGDVPSACASDSIIAVGNVSSFGAIIGGHGKESVDIAAPGTRIYSTLPNGEYGYQTGTSMATPYVAGAIAYLYSVASDAFLEGVKDSPREISRELKKIMMDHSRVAPSFRNWGTEIKSNSVLDLFESSLIISQY